jgi:hypothetical protein
MSISGIANLTLYGRVDIIVNISLRLIGHANFLPCSNLLVKSRRFLRE